MAGKSFVRWHLAGKNQETEVSMQASYAPATSSKSFMQKHENTSKAWKAIFKGCIEPGDVIIDRGVYYLYLTQYNSNKN